MPRRNRHQDVVDPSWDDLRFLESLDRLGSATAASRELGVAPSTVYRRIAALEQSTGVLCYSQRDGRVTPVGRELAELARKTQASIGRVLRQANDARDSVRGRVTLTTLDGFAPLLTEGLVTLGETYPNIELVLDVSLRGASIRKGEADIALTTVPRPPRQLVGRRLFMAKCGIYGTPERAQHWEQAPWVVLGPPLHSAALGRWERRLSRGARIAVATTSRLTINRLIAAGVGIGAIPHVLADEYPNLVEIDALRDNSPDARLPVWLLTHPELRSTAAVQAVLRVLADALVHASSRGRFVRPHRERRPPPHD